MDNPHEEEVSSLSEALSLGPRSHVALVGAGGKTTLMRFLAEELIGRNMKVAATTTTKVHWDEAGLYECLLLLKDEQAPERILTRCLSARRSIFVGSGLLSSGKIQGISPVEADRLFSRDDVDHLIVEADGASRRPLKAPAEHEPVIPASATLVVALMGCEVLGRPSGPDYVFRQDIFSGITGIKNGDILSAEALKVIFLDPRGLFKGSPDGAGKVAFLNKTDLAGRMDEVEMLSRLLLADKRGNLEAVVSGSFLKKRFRVMRRIS
ncbi:MAG: putative selenium-dependent hydroxylase accessory protein YqeC [Desulfobacteraceae bacterium]|jgi:probable selenium-dependent hydroxylase accessory protein YqeC|nr:MAG: putative selenium-dependent hydroxylase accessory protein YqeC [Desulfobacteraceae bacterium]